MKVASVFEKFKSDEEKIEVIQKVYNNCWESETCLFNALSKIASICLEQGGSVYEKVDEMREIAADALERSKQIGLTNPDLYGSMDRRNSLAKQMKLARMREVKKLIKKRVVRKNFVV
jgi:hypothetical protein